MKKQLIRFIPIFLMLLASVWLLPAAAANAEETDIDSLSARVAARGYLAALKTGYVDGALLGSLYLADSATESGVAAELGQLNIEDYTLTGEALVDDDTVQFTAVLQPDSLSLLLTVSRIGNQWRITNLMWAATDSVKLVSVSGTVATTNAAEALGMATVTTGELNIRSGPGTGYTVLTTLKQGQTVDVIGTNAAGTWFNVAQNGTELGWMTASTKYVDSNVSADLPVIATTGSTVTAAATSTPSTGTMIVQAQSGGMFYLVSDDHAELTPLTSGIDPVLSPDGTQIAFTRWTSGEDGTLWIYDLTTGTEWAVLGEMRQVKSPTWSADGSQLVVAFQTGGRPYVEIRTTTLGSKIPRDAYDIQIGSTSGKVTYKLPADPYYKLRLIDAATGAFEDLPSATYSMAPTWDTANDWRVVFANTSDGLLQLDLNRDEYFTFTEDSSDRSPVFSPDGSTVAVSYSQDDHWEIHTIDTTTSERAQLTSTPPTVAIEQMIAGQDPQAWNNAAPEWSPDGSQIAFVSDRSGKWEFWVMNADGSNPQLLLSAEAAAQLDIDYNGMDEKLISWR